jgi:hypothetical protein
VKDAEWRKPPVLWSAETWHICHDRFLKHCPFKCYWQRTPLLSLQSLRILLTYPFTQLFNLKIKSGTGRIEVADGSAQHYIYDSKLKVIEFIPFN